MSSTKYLGRKLILFLSILAAMFLLMGFWSIRAEAAENLKISATLSRNSLYAGGTATVKATVTGGRAPYTYRVAYSVDNGELVYVNNYNTSPEASFVYADPGVYKVRVFGRDKDGKNIHCDLSFTAEDDNVPLANKSSLDISSIQLGEKITIRGNCSGGRAPYTYSYYYVGFGNVQKTLSVNTSATTQEVSFPSAGYYTIKCIVKDGKGNSATRRFSVVCKETTGQTLKNTSSLPVEKIKLGDILHINGSAVGGVQPCMYAYFYSKDGTNYTKAAGYTQDFNCTLKFPDIGTYKIKVIVKDLTGRSLSRILTVDSYSPTRKAFTSTSKISSGKAVQVNSTVTMFGSATGGTKPYKYAYYYRKGNTDSWKCIKSFCTAEEASVKLTEEGMYSVRVAVRDYTGKTINKTFSVKSLSDEEAKLVDTSQTMNVNFGCMATITAPKEKGEASYSFSYRKSTDKDWILLQDFNENRVASFRPREVGTYQVKVTTQTETGTSSYIINVVVSISKEVYDELKLINEQRRNAGLDEVTLDDDLTYVARIRAEELVIKYAHTRPDGSNCFTILDEYGVDYISRTTENIAWGYSTADEVMSVWVNSAGHRANILDSRVTKVGIGINGVNWVQLFSD